ncbi:AAA family ATPase [Anaerosporobacter sp.]|uniref:AAA family ATPase n=1 Tax=Anaerosporobacter sp. TaxID=1872529 RepID=UPI00286F8035|nr:ATP-binding protein [Anaerosporobacter sp.]
MLLKYIVNNYKSIGHDIEFSMFPDEEILDDNFLTTIDTKMGKWKVLRRGAFFGPNAAGKSNFIKSIEFARDYIVEEKRSGKATGIDQFKGEFDDLNNVTTFQFMIYTNGDVYDYGFSLDRIRVQEEWLMILTNKGFVPMFTRTTDKENKTLIEITPKFARSDSKERKLAEVLKDSMQENQRNQLFLYKLFDNGIKRAEKIVSWFENVKIIYPNTKIQGLPIRVKQDEDFREFLSKTLSKLDTGVFNISASAELIDFNDLIEEMEIPKDIVNQIEEMEMGIVNLDGKYFIFSEKDNRTMFVQLKFEHHLNNEVYKFNMEDESDGTKRLLDLLPILFRMDNSSDTIYFIDELDRSLHTKLSKYFLDKFIRNSKGSSSQIVFTAHDVNLINLNEFIKEEIWFIEKNQMGETKLKPLSDFDIVEEQDILKDYLNGRFGAVPVIRGGR